MVSNDKIVESLKNLQKELVEQLNERKLSTDERILLFKINSCLFSEYPH